MNTLQAENLTTSEIGLQLNPLPVMTGWSDFTRGTQGGTAAIFETIIPGTYLEVRDKKFKSNSIILIRRSDFEKLIKSSRQALNTSLRVKKILFSISKTTASIAQSATSTANQEAMNIIEAVHTQASIGLELASATPLYASDEEFFAEEIKSLSADGDVTPKLPKNKADLKRGIKTKP